MKPEDTQQELPPFPSLTTTSDAYAHELYRDVVEEDDIGAFLDEESFYDTTQARWSIPAAPTTTESLVNSFYSVISSIVRRFVRSTDLGVKRDVVSTYGVPACEEKDDEGYRVCPVLVLQGTGPSFQIPAPIQAGADLKSISVGYGQMVTFFSVKPDAEARSTEEEVDEMGTYARRILYNQPNRSFVRCITFTEKHARLIHFDRAGAEITPPIDFHRHPSTLVRLIAGLGSTDERLLGIDTSIQWTIVNGRKEKGTLTTTGPSGEPKMYPIVEQIRTPRHSIYGRATTCWRVQDPDTLEEFVVKESWQPGKRQGEHELLEVVKGIPGIVQMVSYETGRAETKDFRCPSTSGRYQNRFAVRVTLKAYGPSIEHFTSILEVLYALRDAIVGHQKLTSDDIRILHRDVSVYNILRGRPGAPVGERGVLIDLDLAFRPTELEPTVKVNYNVGIRAFQPLFALGSQYMEDEAPPHDYLDDLEAFFFVLIYIMLLYRPDGSRHPNSEEGPSILDTWSDEDPGLAYTNKKMLLSYGKVRTRTGRLITASWGPICADLFEKFRDFVLRRSSEKQQLQFYGKGTESLHSQRNEHYSAVLAMLDEAAQAIKASKSPGSLSNEPSQPSASPPAPTPEEATPLRSAAVCDSAILRSGTNPPMFDTPIPDVEAATPAIRGTPVEVLPTIASLPPPLKFATQLRRSARIRDLHIQPTDGPSGLTVEMVSSAEPQPAVVAQLNPQPRRSARIQKRRLGEERYLEASQPHTKRIKKSVHAANRRR